VTEVLPRWSGETLDLIVDFTTYVFVPAYAIVASGLLPNGLAIPAGVLIVVTGALYFADRQMKTADNYFRGFPAVWNLAALYLYLLEPPPWLAAVMIVTLAALSFAPIKFLHPLRVKHLRVLNIALLGAWSVLAALAVVRDLNPGPYVIWPLVAIAVYFFAVGLLRRAA
jgi:phosphatidylcholine synthase